MTNEQKYKTAEERAKAFKKFCGNMQCSTCQYKCESVIGCSMNWLADEYKEQDLPFMVKTEVRNGFEVSTICSFDGKAIRRSWYGITNFKAYCDSLNAAALAWHKRMMKKEWK